MGRKSRRYFLGIGLNKFYKFKSVLEFYFVEEYKIRKEK